MGNKRRLIKFTVEWPPAAEYKSTDLCPRCQGELHVWFLRGHPISQVTFCPACWKATASPQDLLAANGTPNDNGLTLIPQPTSLVHPQFIDYSKGKPIPNAAEESSDYAPIPDQPPKGAPP